MYIQVYIAWEQIMKQATFTELRNNAKLFFDFVEAGKPLRILRNGKPIADIIPIAPEVPSWKHRIAQPLVLDGGMISDMILEDRGN